MNYYYPTAAHDYRYELHKDMNFAAAHYVVGESAGVCQRMHGHTYYCDVTIAGDELDEIGFLVNFKTLKDLVHKKFDHRLLNEFDIWKDRNPTTEVVAETIYETIQSYLDQLANRPVCIQVLVRETPTSYVIYRPRKSK
jgi:6-pyruvoyltetrahydropterin/6-carboxytetrahydropterin synthase